jgi:uncharacterized protein (TIGR02246 family)
MVIPVPNDNGTRLGLMRAQFRIAFVHRICKPQPTRLAAFSFQIRKTLHLDQRIFFNFAVAILLALYGASTSVLARDLGAEMEAENNRWLAVYAKRDAQAFGGMYTTDAIIVPQGGPPIKGRTAIVQYWDKILKNGFQSPALEIIDFYQEGKLAYQTCRWSVLKIQYDGLARSLTGNTLRIFERQRDGRWLIKVHMSNTDWLIP